MHNLFEKKEPITKVIDKIAVSEPAKLQAMLAQWNSDRNTAFVFWFEDSLRQAKSFFACQTIEPVALLNIKEAGTKQLDGKKPVFAEHYPLRSSEEYFYKKLRIKVLTIFSCLNEPLIKLTGAGKIIKAFNRMGIIGSEIIQHRMISEAIRNTQERIEKMVLIDASAPSQKEWLEKNYTY